MTASKCRNRVGVRVETLLDSVYNKRRARRAQCQYIERHAVDGGKVLNRQNDSQIAQFMRYGAVGAVALAGDVGTLVFLTESLGVYYLWSAAIAFCVGVAIHYTFSVLWVFRVRRFDNRMLEFTIFGVIGIVG